MAVPTFDQLTDAETAQFHSVELESAGLRRTKQLLDRRDAADRWKIGEVIEMTEHRSCLDPRDVIFGTLPLLEGAEQKPIAPDYTITPYQLAVNMLEYWAMQPLSVALLVVKLGLQRNTPEIVIARQQRIMQARSSSTLDDSSFQTHGQVKHRRVDRHRGIQLGSNPELRLNSPLNPDAGFSRIIASEDGREVGRVCPSARLGDWFLFPVNPVTGWARQKPLFHPHGLVVRAVDDTFKIIGIAHFPGWYPRGGQATYFAIFWDPSDYVVFTASMIYDVNDDDHCEEGAFPLSVQLNMEVCRAPFSSYVKGLAGRGIADNQFIPGVPPEYRRQWRYTSPS